MKPTDDKHGGLLFRLLRESADFSEFARILKRLTGLSMALNTADGALSCMGIPGDPGNPLCKLIRGTAEGARRCEDCDHRQQTGAGHAGRPRLYTCHAGFYDLAVPILVQGQHVATISSGQVLPERPSAAGLRRVRERLAWLAVDAPTLRRAYRGAPWMPRRRLVDVMALLELFAGQLCASALRIRELEADLEHPAIRRGRQYVDRHCTEPGLQLAAIAAVAGLSPAYFSDLFHRETGVTLTRYLQARRVDAAKRLLADGTLSITDVAAACGFASLTHFNRVFRRGLGCSPTAYRRQFNVLPGPCGSSAVAKLDSGQSAAGGG